MRISPLQYAPYASDYLKTRGRLYSEPESSTRTAFQRDRDRIIHCAAFRRLEYKTQVFVYHEGDHYRTRLTHSLEVAQIARSIARVLGLNEDLSEALALAHDLGHTPFGHAGEDALAKCMKQYGGFDHNMQTLRILTELEQRYAEFNGLNLTWEALEGTVKHNGPILLEENALAPEIMHYNERHDLELATYPGPEAQVAAIADDVAYNNHDLDDGLRAGLFTCDDLCQLPFVAKVFESIEKLYPSIDQPRLVNEFIRAMIGLMVSDIISESQKNLDSGNYKNAAEIRALNCPVVKFSPEMKENDRILKEFLFSRMYCHHKVNRMASKARRVVKDLFDVFIAEPDCLPPDWHPRCTGEHTADTAKAVSDYIAGMTDRFAFLEHQRLFEIRP